MWIAPRQIVYNLYRIIPVYGLYTMAVYNLYTFWINHFYVGTKLLKQPTVLYFPRRAAGKSERKGREREEFHDTHKVTIPKKQQQQQQPGAGVRRYGERERAEKGSASTGVCMHTGLHRRASLPGGGGGSLPPARARDLATRALPRLSTRGSPTFPSPSTSPARARRSRLPLRAHRRLRAPRTAPHCRRAFKAPYPAAPAQPYLRTGPVASLSLSLAPARPLSYPPALSLSFSVSAPASLPRSPLPCASLFF